MRQRLALATTAALVAGAARPSLALADHLDGLRGVGEEFAVSTGTLALTGIAMLLVLSALIVIGYRYLYGSSGDTE